MTDGVHLVVEQGPDKGKRIRVPPQGARLGRSSRNDIVLVDEALSRYHCRLFFKPGEGLWVTDLGSANATLVNGKPIQEVRLRAGDGITVGETTLRAIHVDPDARPTEAGEGPLPPGKTTKRLLSNNVLILLLALVTLAALTAWWPKLRARRASPPAPPPASPIAQALAPLEIDYEKVIADSGNIFRYRLLLKANNTISVQIDDLAGDRHVSPTEKPLEPTVVEDLSRFLLDSGFFELGADYTGVQPNVLESYDLSVTIADLTHRAKVVNRPEPEVFKTVRERIETFARNELGLWAIEFPPEKLVDMGREAYLLGKKLYDEREIRYGNLAAAIQSLQESSLCVETVEPKPDFYAASLQLVNDCKGELQDKHNEHNFRAERAIRLREWDKAAEELRILCEMIPDRSDPRNQEARKKLLDVSMRLKAKR